MRLLLFVLVVLALGKVGMQYYIRERSIEDTLIAAYREHAIAACALHATEQGAAAYRAGGDGGSVTVELTVGRPELNVRLWQTSHEAWSARYSDPFLIVSVPGPTGVQRCEYDIHNAEVRDWRRMPERARGGSGTRGRTAAG